jgi:hypothetical protein
VGRVLTKFLLNRSRSILRTTRAIPTKVQGAQATGYPQKPLPSGLWPSPRVGGDREAASEVAASTGEAVGARTSELFKVDPFNNPRSLYKGLQSPGPPILPPQSSEAQAERACLKGKPLTAFTRGFKAPGFSYPLPLRLKALREVAT